MKIQKDIIILVIFVINLNYCLNDVIRLGKCPMVNLQKGFRNRLFSGDWYEIAKNPMLVLSNSRCNKMNLKFENEKFYMKSSQILKSFHNKQVNFEALAYSTVPEEPAKLMIEYPLSLFKMNLTIPYWVLYTDYQTAVIWSCSEHLKILHLEYFWIIARKPYINEERLKELLDILTLYDVDTSYLIKTDQIGCI